MKKTLILLLIIILSLILYSDDFTTLTHWKTDVEKNISLGKDFYETDPPTAPVRQIAEFEQMEGVLICYHPFGVSYDLIRELAEDVILYTIVANQTEENYVTNQYNLHNVNIEHCEFIQAPSDSYWTRDYGPWFMVDGNNEVGIVNFPYNRPRPNDNDIPIEVADYLNIDLFGMNVIHTGGNFMTDGMGIGASSTLVYAENQEEGISQTQVDQRMLDYLGIHTYYTVQDPNNTYIDHIDCWGKFLDIDKILIREVPQSHAQYDEIEEVVAYFEAQTSSYGTPYEIYRVYTPQNQPYTNSLILNNKVLVPITGSTYDDDAIQTYQEAMPGYEVSGFTGNWESTDALHCRTRGLADRGMLYIRHIPISGNVPVETDYTLNVTIIPYSGADLIEGSPKVFYKVNNEEYTSILLSHVENYGYTAIIPEQSEGSEISYYIFVADESGRSANHPYIGEADPHIFCVGEPIPPELSVEPESYDVELSMNSTTTELLTLSNIGGGEINYSLHIENAVKQRNITGSYLECSAEEFTPGVTVDWHFSAYCYSDDGEWIKNVWLQFPSGVTVNSSTDLVGGSGGPIHSQGQTGDGVLLKWIDNQGYGNIYPDETATATVNVTIDPDFVDDIRLSWTLFGDEYGYEPHVISGEIIISSTGEPITWIELSDTEGTLYIDEIHEIAVNFNSLDLGIGVYNCNIVVEDDLRNETLIPVTLTVISTAYNEDIIQKQIILRAYPNPFNPEITISFDLTQEHTENAELVIYNIKGQKIKEFKIKNVKLKINEIVWDGNDEYNREVPSGIYFYKLIAGKYTATKKMILMK